MSRLVLSRRQLLARAGAAAAGGVVAACESWARRAPMVTPVPLVYDDKGGLFIEVHVHGNGPVRLLLDTGASRSTLSTPYVAMLGIPTREGATIEGTAGKVTTRDATAEIVVPGLGTEPVDVAVYDFGSYDHKCVGILGAEFLRRAPFRLRYRVPSLDWNAPRPERSVAMTLDGGIPRIGAIVNGKPLELRVDTGAAFPPGPDAYMNLTEAQAKSVGLTGEPIDVFTATGTGDAVLKLPVHRLASLEVAGVAIPRAFAIVQPRVGYFERPDAVGFLGNSVLEKLDPFFDYAAGVFGIGL